MPLGAESPGGIPAVAGGHQGVSSAVQLRHTAPFSGSLCPSCVGVTFVGDCTVFSLLDTFKFVLCFVGARIFLAGVGVGDGGGGESRDCPPRPPPPIASNHSQGFTESFSILPNHCHLQARGGSSSQFGGSTHTSEMAFLLAIPFMLGAHL